MSTPVAIRSRAVSHSRLVRAIVVLLCLAVVAPWAVSHGAGNAPANPSGYTNFETEPVRPLALSPDGTRLFALNTADDHLEVYAVNAAGLVRLGDVAVGLRPAAVAARTNVEVWVTNLLSDSVSIVDVSQPAAPRVVRTLAVGDEPRDIVVAGPNHDRVFVTTARRGDELKSGVGRADVWVFDAKQPAAPPQIVTLFGTKPRALAVSPDGRRVYAAIFHSGNRTTTVDERTVLSMATPTVTPNPTITPAHLRTAGAFSRFIALGDRTGPDQSDPTATPDNDAFPPPPVSVIVREDGRRWFDDQGRDWSAGVPFDLMDEDVFVLDAAAPSPSVLGAVAGVGTILFNMAVQPGSGELWVTNTDAHNLDRTEPKVKSRAIDSRVTRLLPSGAPDAFAVHPVGLNPHIDASKPVGSPDEVAKSLNQPLDIVFNADGSRAYVAAFGSRLVAVLDPTGAVLDRIPVGFGPSGLALDAAHDRLIVLNHLDASLSIIDLTTRSVQRQSLAHDPTPPEVRAGRPFLYDAALTSGHGDQSCGSCHVFADTDGLAWDLGDPNGEVVQIPFDLTHENFLLKPRDFRFHPLKGPMIVQSLRGLLGSGPMHWRGDRFGPEENPGDELASFQKFRPAFKSLLGRSEPISETGMVAFAKFALTIHYPPNPIQNLDRSLTVEQAAGEAFFSGSFPSDSGLINCAGCHSQPNGTNGLINFEGDRTGQDFKVPHLRNLYEKAGRFNLPGPQISGFGFTHDGSTDTVVSLLRTDLFVFPGETQLEHDALRTQLAAYVLAFDTGMAPAVGRQLTVAGPLGGAERALLDTLVARATSGDCDLVAHAGGGSDAHGWLLTRGVFRPDWNTETTLALPELVRRATGQADAVTFTCVPPGDGVRSALDRDLDGYLNGDELAAGSDPADARSVPTHTPPAPGKGLYFPSVMR